MNNRILHIISELGGGGRERRMTALVRALWETGEYTQAIVVMADNREYSDILPQEISITRLSETSHFGKLKELGDIIDGFNPDIVHSWVDTPTELIAIPMLKVRYGFRYVAGFVADGNAIKRTSTKWWASRLTFAFADKIISNSRAGLVAKEAPMGKSAVIYNGFDPRRIPQGIDKAAKKAELGLPDGILVTMVARVTPAKDFESFIKLAERASKERSGICFVAVGDGPLLDDCRKAAKTSDADIRFLGARKDIEEIFSISDVSVLFSNSSIHAEGVSNSILESMAVGCPVIASDGGGTAEIIEDGKNGFIVPPKDYETAFRYLDKILMDSSLRSSFSISAKNTVEERFATDDKASEYIAIYDEILHNNSRHRR